MDPLRVDQWHLVIKVKHGDTLRRFGAYVHGQFTDHNMNKLRAKIISLFKFSTDADFILTYTDEDGDTVTLEDDDELRDAVIRQRLNPLRINVQMIPADNTERSETSSLPTVGEQQICPYEPLLGVVPNLMTIAEKAVASSPAFAGKVDDIIHSEPFRSAVQNVSKDVTKALSPVLAQVVEQISNLGLSTASQTSRTTSEASGSSVAAATHGIVVEPKASTSDKRNTPSTVGAGATPPPPVDLNKFSHKDVAQLMHPFDDLFDSVWSSTTSSEKKEVTSSVVDGNSVAVAASSNKQSLTNPQTPAAMQSGFNPGPGVVVGGNPYCYVPSPGVYPMLRPSRRSAFNEISSHTFHRGVQCDGCGMHPIVGPRFKSVVKDDYDLCDICFTQMSNQDEYIRMDHSPHAPYDYSSMFQGLNSRPAGAKLESRFIADVTVSDGTVMPPSARFTKIWRLRNNGTVPWPIGTQLLWVGGDQFGDRRSVNLEIPSNGFPIDQELDVSVDFTAPATPGRYVSYWRMTSPTGQMFGQRVWVLIEVICLQPVSDAGKSMSTELNLNLPPESDGENDLGIIIDIENSNDGVDVTVTAANAASGDSHPLVDVLQATPPPANAPLVALPAADKDKVEETLLKELEEMGFKQIDLNKEVLRRNEYDMEQSVNELCGFDKWDPLLLELQDMGFGDAELNKQLLVKNGGSIKRVVLELISGKPE